jgi:hypothetical protein
MAHAGHGINRPAGLPAAVGHDQADGQVAPCFIHSTSAGGVCGFDACARPSYRRRACGRERRVDAAAALVTSSQPRTLP